YTYSGRDVVLCKDRLIVLRQLVPFRQVDKEVVRGAAFPPTGIIVVRRNLVEAELLVIVRTDPLGRINGALLQGRINIAAGDLLGDDAQRLQRLAGPAADAHLEAFEIVDGLDLFTEPAAHLCAGIAADKRVHVVLLAKLVHQFHAVAVVEPRVLLTGIQPERDGTEQCPGRILADVVVRGGVADL